MRRAAEDFNPGDNAGTSTNIVTSSQDTANDFSNGQLCRREDLLLNQMNTLQCMSNEELEKQFRSVQLNCFDKLLILALVKHAPYQLTDACLPS